MPPVEHVLLEINVESKAGGISKTFGSPSWVFSNIANGMKNAGERQKALFSYPFRTTK